MAAPGFEFFKSTDAGAPSLYGAAGRMIAVLDWVLVTKGGWAKAYSGTNLAAYRSATGNRFYLRVDDTQTTLARLRGYRAMTAISSGSNLFPPTGYAPSATWGAAKSSIADTTPRRYWGIRTNRYVFMVVEVDNRTVNFAGRSVFAFGDVPSLCEADSFNTVIFGAEGPESLQFPYSFANSWPNILSMSPAVNGPHMAATPSGGVNSPSSGLGSMHSPIPQHYSAADAKFGKSGRLQLSEFTVLSSEETTPNAGIAIFRARLPNVRHGAGMIPRAGLSAEEVVTISGRSYLLLGCSAYDPLSDGGADNPAGFFALETSDTDGAL